MRTFAQEVLAYGFAEAMKNVNEASARNQAEVERRQGKTQPVARLSTVKDEQA